MTNTIDVSGEERAARGQISMAKTKMESKKHIYTQIGGEGSFLRQEELK